MPKKERKAEYTCDGWYQEYKTCSCTQIEVFKVDLLGYCAKHGTDAKKTIRIQLHKGDTLGQVYNG